MTQTRGLTQARLASAICLVCVLLTAAALSVMQSAHDHDGDQCAVCAKILDSRNLINSFRASSAAPLRANLEVFPSRELAAIPRSGQATPVSLKVRIDR